MRGCREIRHPLLVTLCDPGLWFNPLQSNDNTDEENNEKLLHVMKFQVKRTCRFRCALAVALPNGKVLHEVDGVCEGMLLGKPILCSSVSDIPMIIEDGVNGLVCDPKNPRSIADALINALNFTAQDMREMGARNRKKAIALFAKDVNVNNYINVFNEK